MTCAAVLGAIALSVGVLLWWAMSPAPLDAEVRRELRLMDEAQRRLHAELAGAQAEARALAAMARR